MSNLVVWYTSYVLQNGSQGFQMIAERLLWVGVVI
jgi:hypothetical protein